MVSARQLAEFLKENEKPYRKLVLSAGDPGAVAVTKLSGVPWWPEGVERPRCVDGHLMDFIAQIRLDDVPGIDWPPALLSFHYCHQCTWVGNMTFGLGDRGHQQRYDVRVFSDLEHVTIDGLGIVAEPVVDSMTATFVDGRESMGIHDIWEAFPETARPMGIPRSIKLDDDNASKLAGWPSWQQNSKWPEEELGEPMDFVGQLDMYACDRSAWVSGCAYLFVSPADEDEHLAELVIQTT